MKKFSVQQLVHVAGKINAIQVSLDETKKIVGYDDKDAIEHINYILDEVHYFSKRVYEHCDSIDGNNLPF